MKKKTIVIFGISSFVGSNLAEFLKKDFRIIGTYYKTPIFIPGILCLPCDVLSRDSIQFLLYSFRPDVTIYCIGLTSVEDCAKHEKLADALNTVGVFNVSSFTERYKSKFCYISSAYIFPGFKKIFLENDSPDPETQYGKTKAAAEFYIQKSCLNYIIFRCCILYGRSINPRQRTWFENLERKMCQQENTSCDAQIHHGFLDVLYLAMILKMGIEKDVTNRLFQVSSINIMTYYEFALLYAKTFQTNESLIQKGSWPFPLTKMEFSGEGTEGNKKYYQIDTNNLENYFNIEMPSIEESMIFTFYRLGGDKNNLRHSQKSNIGIQFI